MIWTDLRQLPGSQESFSIAQRLFGIRAGIIARHKSPGKNCRNSGSCICTFRIGKTFKHKYIGSIQEIARIHIVFHCGFGSCYPGIAVPANLIAILIHISQVDISRVTGIINHVTPDHRLSRYHFIPGRLYFYSFKLPGRILFMQGNQARVITLRKSLLLQISNKIAAADRYIFCKYITRQL